MPRRQTAASARDTAAGNLSALGATQRHTEAKGGDILARSHVYGAADEEVVLGDATILNGKVVTGNTCPRLLTHRAGNMNILEYLEPVVAPMEASIPSTKPRLSTDNDVMVSLHTAQTPSTAISLR